MAENNKKNEDNVIAGVGDAKQTLGVQTKTDSKKNKEVVEVPVDILKDIRTKMDAQDKMLEKQTAEIERLTYASDKGRLHRYDQRREEDIIRTARVATWVDDNGILQVVSGWNTESDRVYFDQKGAMHVDQKIRLLLGSGETRSEVVLSHLYWFQNMTSVSGDIVDESIDKVKGTHFRTIRLKDGEMVKMDIRFINP